jgi:hypothetical protein
MRKWNVIPVLTLLWIGCGDSKTASKPLPVEDFDAGSDAAVVMGEPDATAPFDGGAADLDAAAPANGASDAGPLDCYLHPTTHLEIINACTDAVHIDKHPELPLLRPDGSLPKLP